MHNVIRPGDAVLAHSKGLYAHLIRFGQRLRWRNTKYNHTALVESIDPNGDVWCIQMGRRGQRVHLSDVAPGGQLRVIPAPDGVDRTKALDYARKCVGIKYGVMTIICIAINIVTPRPIRFDFRREDTLICSALVARSWEHGGWFCPTDPFQITPAEFEVMFAKDGWDV